jgi:anti-sigma B factor antagonist
MSEPTPTPQDRLDVTVEEGDRPTFVLSGDLDPHTSPYLQSRIDDALGEGASTAVLDVGQVSFVDSAGLRVIADTHRRLMGNGGGLVLRNPSKGLEKLLSVTGLSDHVTIER